MIRSTSALVEGALVSERKLSKNATERLERDNVIRRFFGVDLPPALLCMIFFTRISYHIMTGP